MLCIVQLLEAMMFNPKKQSICYKLHFVTRTGFMELNRLIEPYGISQGQFIVLTFLWENNGLSQKELCERVRVEQPTLANTLKRMERDGLVYRNWDEGDKRYCKFYLTGKGERLGREMDINVEEIQDNVLKTLTKSERELFNEFLDRIIDNISEKE